MSKHKGWRMRADGKTFRAEVWLPHAKRYWSKSFAKASEAKAWAITETGKVIGALDPSAVIGPRRASTRDIAEAYLLSLTARNRSPSHLANVKRTLAALERQVPDLLHAGAGAAIERWLDGYAASAGTRNRMLTETRALMRWAIKRDLIEKDPSRAMERFTKEAFLKPLFTIDELRTLFFHEHDYRRRFVVMTYLGLRSDEAAALLGRNIERSGNVALIRKCAGHRLKRNKERIVPLQEEMLLLVPSVGPDEPVCPVIDSSGSRAFRAFLRSAGVPIEGRTPHSCRHTYASIMVATGIPDQLLKGYMGHESTQTTAGYTSQATRYVHAVEHWGRGKLRICEGFHSLLKRNCAADQGH